MNILKNAIDSIELGIEDYKTDDPRRLLSAVRNFYSGILLLFKHKLALLSQDNDEALIKQYILPVKENGKIIWKGNGKKTVDFRQIQERFKSLEINVDWKKLKKVQDYRNNIEHYYDKEKTKTEVVQQYISDCFIVICDFIRTQLDEDPKGLFSSEIWGSFIEVSEVYKQDKGVCSESIKSLEWPCDKTLALINEFVCTECGSELIGPLEDFVQDAIQNTFQCRMCGEEWIFDEWLSIVREKESEGDYTRISEGGEPTFAYCPECSEEYYHVFERVCINCGAEGPFICKLCGVDVPDCELSLYEDEGVCSWCYQVRMKDD